MAKFNGFIGFAETKNPVKGVWSSPDIVERKYKGDVLQNNKRSENSGNVNDDISLSNKISIVADNYAYDKLFAMKYVKWMGVAWKITNVEVQNPRLILTFGGVYNGEQT